MRGRLKKSVLTASAAVLILAVYYIFTQISGIYIPCVFNKFTGLRCPGCGITRMFINLLHLDFKAAFKCNQLLFVTFPLIIAMLARIFYRYVRHGVLKPERWIDITCIVLVAMFLIFAVLRNIFSF